jgi:hypothetical protein
MNVTNHNSSNQRGCHAAIGYCRVSTAYRTGRNTTSLPASQWYTLATVVRVM